MSEPVLRMRRPQGVAANSLRPPPTEPPPLEGPSLIGGLLGYKPTATLGAQIGRWYDNSGGLKKAIAAAQESQSQRDLDVLTNDMWPKWNPDDVTRRTATVEATDLPDGYDGQWRPDGSVLLRNGPTRSPQSVLEHELGHNAYIRDQTTAFIQAVGADATSDVPGQWSFPDEHGWPDDKMPKYLMDPAEVDVRLAEIKRRYAHHTGRLADSPEEAGKAWKWYRENQQHFQPGAAPGVERPGEYPTLEPEQFDFYDSLPDDSRQKLLHRMPELVRGSVLKGLRGAGFTWDRAS